MLDNMPRLRLSDDHLKFILRILKELDVPDVPSFKSFRKLQSTLDDDISITTIQNVSPAGNVSYSNSLVSLIAMVSELKYIIFDYDDKLPQLRITRTQKLAPSSIFILKKVTKSRSHGKRENS